MRECVGGELANPSRRMSPSPTGVRNFHRSNRGTQRALAVDTVLAPCGGSGVPLTSLVRDGNAGVSWNLCVNAGTVME